MNKHKIIQEYVGKFLEDNYLYFESVSMLPNIRAIVPQYGDYIIKTDITGAKYKQYTFAFVAVETFDKDGTSDINTQNMELLDKFIKWIEERNTEKDYPDLGENTSEYSIEPLQNMANIAMIDESTSTAKYMLACRINYKELE